MKNLFFAAGIIVCTLLSCSSSKNFDKDVCPHVTKSEDYFKSSNAICEKEAVAMINRFPRHKTRFNRKNNLSNSWSSFDLHDLQNLSDHIAHIDSIKIYFAGQIIRNRDTFRYPTYVMQIKLKNVDKNLANQFQYIKAPLYCPPPESCTLARQ